MRLEKVIAIFNETHAYTLPFCVLRMSHMNIAVIFYIIGNCGAISYYIKALCEGCALACNEDVAYATALGAENAASNILCSDIGTIKVISGGI